MTDALIVKITLTLALALFIVRIARTGRAATRHLLLTTAFVVVALLPIAAAVTPVKVEVAQVSAAIEEYFAESDLATGLDARSHSSLLGDAGASRQLDIPWMELLITAWIAGVLFFAVPLVVGFVQVSRLRRAALPWCQGQMFVDALVREAGLRTPINVLRHESLFAPATSGMWRPIILFPSDADGWTREDLLRAAVHEIEHVRRRDCFIGAFARLVCSFYWFHPLIWVAWRRLGLEAERACDDAVLRRSNPTAYADQLVALAARLSDNTRQPLLAMANRSDLVQRVAALLDPRAPRGHVRLALRAAIGLGAVAFVAAIGPLQASGRIPKEYALPVRSLDSIAQNESTAATRLPSFEAASLRPKTSRQQTIAGGSAQTPGAPPVFEVAIIKPNVSGITAGGLTASGYVTFNNQTVRDLIARAYNVPFDRVVGGPDWLDRERFDFTAKAEAETSAARRMLMLRVFLAERLKLVVRTDSKETDVFALLVARSDRRLGPQLRPSSVDCEAVRASSGGATAPPTPPGERPVCGGLSRLGFISGGGVTMAELAERILRPAGRPVIDRTGLPGGYDLDLKWVPDDVRRLADRPIDGPSFAAALEEQLGLRLEATRAPVEVIVVESVARPAEN